MGQIDEAMVAILTDFSAVGKDRRNSQQNFNFRGIDDICNELHPLMKRHGVYITTEVMEAKRESHPTKGGGLLHYSILTVKYTFHAKDGTKTDPIVTVGEGMDSGDKASNKAMSAALKYALIQAFAIPTVDAPDADAETPPPHGPQHTQPAPQPALRQQTQQRGAQRQPAPSWRECVTPKGKRMGEMTSIELLNMEVSLSCLEERGEKAENYRKQALAGVEYYVRHSADFKLVKTLGDGLDHDLHLPDEKEVLSAAIERLTQWPPATTQPKNA